jgi:hypothetical protein
MIFDQTGKFIADWRQFGRPSGLYITRNDVLYVTDSESQSDTPGDPSNLNAGFGYNPGVHRGIRVGLIKDGRVTAFIPDPHPGFRTAQAAAAGDRTNGRTSFSDGVAADLDGNVYGAEVGPMDLKKYVKGQ